MCSNSLSSAVQKGKNMMDDWRLTDQKKYLLGQNLRKKMFIPRRKEWEHEHCVFCWAKFPTEYAEGYCTEDESVWICPGCYQDFREKFQWTVLEESKEKQTAVDLP